MTTHATSRRPRAGSLRAVLSTRALLLLASVAAMAPMGCARAPGPSSAAPPRGARQRSGTAQTQRPSTRPAALSRSRATFLVGVLTRQALRYCPNPFKVMWLRKHWEVGFVWLPRADGAPRLDALDNRLVVAIGAPTRRPDTSMPPGAGRCLIAQMRSDWVMGMHGVRRRHGGGPGASLAGGPNGLTAFSARTVRAFDGLTLEKRGDRVNVRLTNTLGRDLEDVALRMHYEGCHGKPGHRQREHRVARLAAGQSVATSLPQIVGDARRGDHRALSLQIIARGTQVHFDLDLSLHRASPPVSIDCPRP